MVDVVKNNLNGLTEMCRKHRVKSLVLIGSAARKADFTGASDIDFLYEFDPQVPVENYADNYFNLLNGLTALFQRPVDLVPAEGLRNRYFLQSIAQDKVILYEA